MTRNAPAKINAFLKITGKRGDYHEMVSRFIRIDTLFDTVSFVPKSEDETVFDLEGDFGCPLEKNTVYKAYRALIETVDDPAIHHYFKTHKVLIEKTIPSFAGLGGGSSDAATFLLMANEAIDLGLSKEALASMGKSVGADVPFFIFECASANVEGIGEIVTPLKESLPEFELMTPQGIACDTVAVFQNFRQKFYRQVDRQEAQRLLGLSTRDALAHFSLQEANDLFASAQNLYPTLAAYAKEGWFFSGSGSTFFRIKESHG